MTSNHRKKTTTCGIGNSGPGLGQVQKCGGIKHQWDPRPSLHDNSPMAIQMLTNIKKNLHRFTSTQNYFIDVNCPPFACCRNPVEISTYCTSPLYSEDLRSVNLIFNINLFHC